MEHSKVSLCPACTACPEVEILGTEVRIGEAGNLAVLLLAALVLVPPVALAVDHCAGMGHMCEAPCGASCGSVFTPVGSMSPESVSMVTMQPLGDLPVSPVASLDPPPEPVLLSA